jgi:hypothetical protein
MKPILHRFTGRRHFDFGRPLTVATLLLLAALTMRADTPYTATGQLIGEPLPGIFSYNASGWPILRCGAMPISYAFKAAIRA